MTDMTLGLFLPGFLSVVARHSGGKGDGGAQNFGATDSIIIGTCGQIRVSASLSPLLNSSLLVSQSCLCRVALHIFSVLVTQNNELRPTYDRNDLTHLNEEFSVRRHLETPVMPPH